MSTETVNDNTSAELEGVSAEEVDTSLSEDISVEDLMGLNEEVAPEFAEGVNHTGMRPLSEWTKHLPEDVRKHLANIRSDYTRKTQEISSIRKQLEEERRALSIQKEATLNNPVAKRASEIAASKEEYDVFDPEGMKKEIERQAAKMLSEMLKPAQEEIQIQQRKLQLEDFKRQNPELTNPEYRNEIAKMLTDRPELKLEDAFYIVKAKVDAGKMKEKQAEMDRISSERKAAIKKTSIGSATTPKGTPQFRDAWSAYQWHKAQKERI